MAATSLGNLLLLPLVLLLVAAGVVGVSGDDGFHGVVYTTKCTPAAPGWSAASDGAFRVNAMALLGALPSAAAATGFASLASVDGGAFARGLCFGHASPSKCGRCLADVAEKVADSEDCATSRRAAVWADRCFIHLSNSNFPSPEEETYHYGILEVVDGADDSSSPSTATADAFVGDLYALAVRLAPLAANDSRLLATATENVPRADMKAATVRALAQCMPDQPAAECGRCLQDSARELTKCCWGSAMQGAVVVVVGYNCHLRMVIPAPRSSIGGFIRNMFTHHLGIAIVFTIALLVLVFGVCLLVSSLVASIVSPSRSENRIPSAMQAAEASPAGHLRGSGAAVKAAQAVATPNTNRHAV